MVVLCGTAALASYLYFGEIAESLSQAVIIALSAGTGAFLLFAFLMPKGNGKKKIPQRRQENIPPRFRVSNSKVHSGEKIRKAPKNYNWIVETQEREREQEVSAAVLPAEERQENPYVYRSPFEPINPVDRNTAAEEEELEEEWEDTPEDLEEMPEEYPSEITYGEIGADEAETPWDKPMGFTEIYIKDVEEDEEEEIKQEPASRYDPGNETGPKETPVQKAVAMPYSAPETGLLKREPAAAWEGLISEDTQSNAEKLIDTLASFGVGARVVNISQGPTVTRYEIQPNIGVKVSKIVNLADDIALNLAATGVRIEAPIPGKAAIGIEVPNKEINSVLLRDVLESSQFKGHPSKLAFGVGKDITGNTVVGDIGKMPHLLIAGATGSGKSVCINTLIVSILYKASPSEVKLLMVDPKVVELGIYNGIPHLLIPVVTDPKKAAGALNWAVQEMTLRYKLFAENNVRDLAGYNRLLEETGVENTLPQIVIIIDELADLMMVAPGEVEDSICRLAQMARAAGMHLVIATQRPSVDVITGVIKANIPSRISFAVSSQIDSRTILDMAGAEKLLGKGDMLYSPIGAPKPIRVQGGFISDREVESVVSHIKASVPAEYDDEIMQKIDKPTGNSPVDSKGDDELLPQAIEMVLELGQASTSLVQRKFKVGYSRAARIVDQMETWGVISPPDGSKPRQVLITKQEWDELNT